MSNTREDDDQLVYYCRSCHSLCIIQDENLAMDGWDGSYCGKCHSTDVAMETIDVWLAEEEQMRRKREELEWKRL